MIKSFFRKLQFYFSRMTISKTIGKDDFSTLFAVFSGAFLQVNSLFSKQDVMQVLRFLYLHGGGAKTSEVLFVFRRAMEKRIPLSDTCLWTKENMGYTQRLFLINVLMKLAKYINKTDKKHCHYIHVIAKKLAISSDDLQTLWALNFPVKNQAYKILGVIDSTDLEELYSAYKKTLQKFGTPAIDTFNTALVKDTCVSIKKSYEEICATLTTKK